METTKNILEVKAKELHDILKGTIICCLNDKKRVFNNVKIEYDVPLKILSAEATNLHILAHKERNIEFMHAKKSGIILISKESAKILIKKLKEIYKQNELNHVLLLTEQKLFKVKSSTTQEVVFYCPIYEEEKYPDTLKIVPKEFIPSKTGSFSVEYLSLIKDILHEEKYCRIVYNKYDKPVMIEPLRITSNDYIILMQVNVNY